MQRSEIHLGLKAHLYHLSNLFLPLSVLVLLIVINLIKGADYLSFTMVKGVFYGNIPNILFGASELVILSIGMTLVTAASRGQDIGIGEAATITSAVFVWFVLNAGEVTLLTIVAAFLLSCVVGLVTVVFIAIVAVVLKTTNLRLYVESVGINPNAARLIGINPKKIIFLTFLIMGICTAVAGFIAVNKAGRHDSVNLLKFIMMDAILAVAIGGNSLHGGKFSITGSIIGAYTIEMLNRTMLRLEIETETIKAFKAVFIIILMVVGSPVVRVFAGKVINRVRTGRFSSVLKRSAPKSVKEE